MGFSICFEIFLVTFVIARLFVLLESDEGGITFYFEVSYKRFYFFVSFYRPQLVVGFYRINQTRQRSNIKCSSEK
jgi:hypothetical protein